MCLAIPGRIVRITAEDPATPCATVDYGGGVVRTAQLLYLPEARPGDWVVVQAGFAVRRLSDAEAEEALEIAKNPAAPAPSRAGSSRVHEQSLEARPLESRT